MQAGSYSKFKECKPEETVDKIKHILSDIGIDTEVTWSGSGTEGCYSNRVTIAHTTSGTNGKGTSRSYALASGYGELMERLENNMLLSHRLFSEEDSNAAGFRQFPDEVLLPYDELICEENGIFTRFCQMYGCRSKEEICSMLDAFHLGDEDQKGMACCLPFADIFNGRIVHAPIQMLISSQGSNGMAAGNTMEEALVQAISEIFERYSARKIILSHMTPPDIPREYLENIPSLMSVINRIEKGGRYEVRVKDCSLSRGFAVVATIIIDKEENRFGVKFASHPSFPLALERTLTEAFQGRNLEEFTCLNSASSDEKVNAMYNLANILKEGGGDYPPTILAGEAEYEFKPLGLEGKSNAELLSHILSLIRREGYEPYIHDSSYLGFPSCFVIIPGMSDIFDITDLTARSIYTNRKVAESFTHINALTEREAKRSVIYTTFKSASLIENSIENTLHHPLTERFPGGSYATLLFRALCQYRLGSFSKAYEDFSLISKFDPSPLSRARALYVSYRAQLFDAKTADELIRALCKEEIAETVIEELHDEETVLSKFYDEPKCYDCHSCALHKKNSCDYITKSELQRKLKTALKRNIPSQQKLLEDMEKLIAENN